MLSAQFQVKSAEADYESLKVTQQKAYLDMKSKEAQVEADYNTAVLQAERDSKLAKDGLVSDIDAKISTQKAAQLKSQLALEKERLTIYQKGDDAALATAKVKVDQLNGEYELKKSQVDQIKECGPASTACWKPLPPPLTGVEEGQKVLDGHAAGQSRPADAPQGAS